MKSSPSRLMFGFILIGLGLVALFLAWTPRSLWAAPALTTIPIAIGDTVNGELSQPYEVDTFTFTATPGQQVFFNLLDSGGLTYAGFKVYDSTGATLVDQCLGCWEPGARTLTEGGVYTITIGDAVYDGVGAYSFKLWNVPPADQFSLAVGDTVSDGVPGAGAGNIESPGVFDQYTFTATPGQQVFFSLLGNDGLTYATFKVTDSTGAVLVDQCLGCGEPGVRTLTEGGTYTITVGNPY